MADNDETPFLHKSPFTDNTQGEVKDGAKAAAVAAQAAEDAEADKLAPETPLRKDDEAAMRLDDLQRIESANHSPQSDEIRQNALPLSQRQGSRIRSFTFRSQSRPSTPLSGGSPVHRQEVERRVCESLHRREDAQIIVSSTDNLQINVPLAQNLTSPTPRRTAEISGIAPVSRGRGRSSRVHSNRVRRGSRGVRATGRRTSAGKENATHGWTIDAQTSQEITLDDELMERYFTQHTRLFVHGKTAS